MEIQNTHSFHSQQVNCNSDFVIYLLECKMSHTQYVGKVETSLNLRLKNHCNDVYKADTITASHHHFTTKDHVFNRDVSFVIIKAIRKNILRRETKKNLHNRLDHETRSFKT